VYRQSVEMCVYIRNACLFTVEPIFHSDIQALHAVILAKFIGEFWGSNGDEYEDGCLRNFASCSLVGIDRRFRDA
jgi:hypothetical protein